MFGAGEICATGLRAPEENNYTDRNREYTFIETVLENDKLFDQKLELASRFKKLVIANNKNNIETIEWIEFPEIFGDPPHVLKRRSYFAVLEEIGENIKRNQNQLSQEVVYDLLSECEDIVKYRKKQLNPRSKSFKGHKKTLEKWEDLKKKLITILE